LSLVIDFLSLGADEVVLDYQDTYTNALFPSPGDKSSPLDFLNHVPYRKVEPYLPKVVCAQPPDTISIACCDKVQEKHYPVIYQPMKKMMFLLCAFLVGCQTDCPSVYSYDAPTDQTDDLPVGSIIDLGMDSLPLQKLVDCIYANRFDQVHSILVYKENLLVFEEYFEGNTYQWDGDNYHGNRIQWHKDSMHTAMSCSKSITSAIAGIAVDQGYLDVQESIFTYLPDHQAFKVSGKEDITIEHLLTMTSGLKWNEWKGAHGTTANDIDRIYMECQQDPIACVLDKELAHEPGTHFTYNGGNMIILGEVIKNAVGQPIRDFGEEHLFHPLGIDSVYWYQFDNGVFACDGSIMLTPRDMLKIGITFLQEGTWNNQRIISAEWVEKSQSAFHNNRNINVPLDDTGKNGYGYTWWLNEVSLSEYQVDLYQASGWGGQEIIVIPELDMVVVFTGGNYTVKKHIHTMLEKYILRAIQ